MVAEALGRRVLTQGSRAPRSAAGPVPRLAPPSATLEPAPAVDLTAVYEAHGRYVWRCLRSLGVRDAVLDDALQDVFVVVQRKLGSFDGGAQLRTWLYAIALRIARRYRERARREPESLEATPESQAPERRPDAEGAAESNQRLALARAALEALDDDKREVFVLARVEQMSAPEIASVLGVPLNTVYSRLRTARLAFEAEVERRTALTRNPA